MPQELFLKEESYKIIGSCIEVYNSLGKGFLEVIYKDTLEYEFMKKNILYEREKEFIIPYKEIILPHKFYADFVVYNKIILEVKYVKIIEDEHIKQTLNYLSVSKFKLGIIVNFGEKSLTHKRVVL